MAQCNLQRIKTANDINFSLLFSSLFDELIIDMPLSKLTPKTKHLIILKPAGALPLSAEPQASKAQLTQLVPAAVTNAGTGRGGGIGVRDTGIQGVASGKEVTAKLVPSLLCA